MDARLDEELEMGFLSSPVNFLAAAIFEEKGNCGRVDAWRIRLVPLVALTTNDSHGEEKMVAGIESR